MSEVDLSREITYESLTDSSPLMEGRRDFNIFRCDEPLDQVHVSRVDDLLIEPTNEQFIFV